MNVTGIVGTVCANDKWLILMANMSDYRLEELNPILYDISVE